MYEDTVIPSLSVGDVVVVPNSFGVHVRLTERREYPENTYGGGPCVVFSTEYVSGDTESLGGYGHDMRNGNWHIQGNNRATIHRVTA